jgi:membrane protease YdiL (CAAX protease family)
VLSLFLFLTIFTRKRIESFIASNFKYFFYSSSIVFGLMHSSNFTGNIYLILTFSVILGGPQIVLGLILGYIRMNHGLKYSFLFHMVVNTSLILTLI